MHPIEVSGGPEADLRHYLRVVWRRKWVLLVLVVAVTAITYARSSAQTPVYQATAEMLMRPRASETIFDQTRGAYYFSPTAIQTEIQVLSSQPVAEEALKIAGVGGGVSAAQIGQTDIVRVSSSSTDPEAAAKVANAYAEAYIEVRQRQAVDDLANAVVKVQDKIFELQGRIDLINERIGGLGSRETAETASLTAERERLISQQQLFQQQVDQLQLDQELKTGGAQLIRPATMPGSPFEPTPRNDALAAMAAAIVLALGAIFLVDHFDDRIRSKEDVDRSAGGRPVLGLIPAVKGWRRKGAPVLVSKDSPTSAASEAYRALRTSIQFIGLDSPLATIQVTSAAAAEGKTTTLANLAVALARAGQRVVVVCCDLRRPRIHEFFGLSNEIGFTSVLLGDVALSEAIQEVPGEERLALLASGPPPPNPAELLTSRRTVEVLTALQGVADVVLIDCPPVLPVTDAAVLSARVDATLVVATARSTTRKQLRRALELLDQVNAPVVGLVLNGVRDDGGYGGYRYYRYGHHDGDASARKAPAVRATR